MNKERLNWTINDCNEEIRDHVRLENKIDNTLNLEKILKKERE